MRFTSVRPTVARVGCFAIASVLIATQSLAIDAEDKAWLERSRDIIRSMEGKPPPAWLKGAQPEGRREPARKTPAASPASPTMLDTLKGARSALPAWASQPPVSNDAREQRRIFVSFAMPEAELIAAMEEAAAFDGVVVLRGLAKGESVTLAGQRLRNLAGRLEKVPEVQIDPFAFRRESVTAVPTISVAQGSSRLSAVGSLALGALATRFANGERGDLGQRGTLYPIAEREMMDDIQARIANVDWKAQREGAYTRYWAQRERIALPVSSTDRLRLFDPSVEVKTDLFAKSGQLVARAGQRVNPQAVMPLRSVWFVFDPSDRRQVARVEREVRQLKFSTTPYMLMATQLDTGREWEHLRTIEDRFGLPITLATQELIDRFGIERVPVRIQGSGARLAITELGVASIGATP